MNDLHELTQKYLTDLETINCPLCKNNGINLVGSNSRGGIKINSVICNTCALIYLNPKPSAKKYHEFYASGDYRRFLNFVKGIDPSTGVNNLFTEEKFNKRKKDGQEIARRYFKDILGSDGLYFDFGCDTGGIMAGVQEETGCKIMGNEPSELSAAYIKEKLGITILNTTMETIGDSDMKDYKGKVKVASIVGVLEHVNDPVVCLNTAYDMLMPGGFLYAESFDVIRRMEMKREGIEDIATIDHQYYFHKQVYEYILRKAGFEVVYFDCDSGNGRMMNVLARKAELDIPDPPEYSPEGIRDKILRYNSEALLYRNSTAFSAKRFREGVFLKAKQRGKKLLSKLRKG